jgi:hypothetical protein
MAQFDVGKRNAGKKCTKQEERRDALERGYRGPIANRHFEPLETPTRGFSAWSGQNPQVILAPHI